VIADAEASRGAFGIRGSLISQKGISSLGHEGCFLMKSITRNA